MVAQNNNIRNRFVKLKIDKMQQNSKWRLCGDRDEMIYDTVIEYDSWAQKESMTRHSRVEKVISWELCEKWNPSQKTRLRDNYQNKRTCLIVNIAVPEEKWLKIKKNKKREKY